MSRVQSVTIRRFKGLQEVTVELDSSTLLIGANNSGKSSILQAIHFAVSVAQTAKLVGEGVAWQRDSFELSFNPTQLIYSPVADVITLATGGVLQEPRDTRVEISLVTDEGQRCTVGLRRGRNRNIAVQLEGRQLGERLMDLQHPFSVYAPGLAGIPKHETHLSPGVVRRIVARGDANLVLRNVLRMLSRNQQAWDEFLNDMTTLFPGIEIAITFDEEIDENILVEFGLADGPWLPLDAAGTSILQASQILAYIGLFRPQVLILDEPDSHLHPNNQRALCDLVYRLAAERNFQALVSTHSRHVLDAMRNRGSLIWLSRGRIVPTADTGTTAMLLDLGALDSVDYFARGGLRCVVASEDADIDPLKALLWSNGFREEETEVARYSGCSNVEAAVVLGTFLRDRAPNLSLVVHRDADYMSEESRGRFNTRLDESGVSAFVTEHSDVEGYFVNAAHLSYANPGLTLERAQALIDEATAATVEESVRAIVNQRTTEAFAVRRRDPNAAVDHGGIAVAAHRDYDASPATMRRGKVLIGRLAAAIQAEMHANPRIYVASPHLRTERLTAISAALWPPVVPPRRAPAEAARRAA